MIFTTISFWLYFFLVYIVFLIAPQKFKTLFLLLASYFFYTYDNSIMLLLIIALTAIVYSLALLIDTSDSQKKKSFFYYLGISLLVINLAYFKYIYFLMGVLLDIQLITEINISFQNVYLPLAISFFTFEFIHYLSDVYRGATPIRNYIQFSLFPAFFPTMIAGPIKRYQDFIGQLDKKHWDVSYDNIKKGIGLIILGSFYKITLSDSICAPIVNEIYDKQLFAYSYDVLIAMVSFSYQIFFDFQGYSLIAIGLALLFGIKIPINFNSPYLSINPSDFWRRWHITLSQWLRDYVFIPLGGSRVNTYKVFRNLIITMLIGGLWHGAGYNFLVWGLLHGLALALFNAVQILKTRNKRFENIIDYKVLIPLWIFLTFSFVTVSWVFFRLETFDESVDVIHSVFYALKEFKHIDDIQILSIIAISIFMFTWKPIKVFLEQKLTYNVLESVHIKGLYLYAMLIITVVSIPQVFNPMFIYFRF